MLRDNLVGLIEPMLISAGADPLALSIQKRASDDRPSCLENPRPQGAESSLTENVTSPFQAEPAQECYSETIERTQVNRPPSDKYGENSGDSVHFWSHQSSEMQIGDHALGPDRASQCFSICALNRQGIIAR